MYAKVFASLWQGTLCGQSDAQLVFIYLLAHADDDQGSVTAAPQAIGALTGLGLERTMAALQVLEGPDTHSTSPTLDGRRLERVGDGWTWSITNYVKYRDIRRQEDRKKQNRLAKQRERSASVSNGQHVSAMSAQVEVEVEAEAEAEAEGTSPAERVAKTRKRPRVSAQPIDEAFLISLQQEYPAINVQAVFEKLLNHRKTYKNQRLALRHWVQGASANGWDSKPKRLTFGEEP